MNSRDFKSAEAKIANWVSRSGAEFHGWNSEIRSDWIAGACDTLADFGLFPTLAEAVDKAISSGIDGVLVVCCSADAPDRHSAGSIPFLDGLHGRIRQGALVAPTGVWPIEDRGVLRGCLLADPDELELTP